jgi:GTP-binding protein EngB required for normal cell division
VTDIDALQRLERLATAAGASEVAAEAAALALRAAEGRFYLACVGEFKRGKSSLINSLLGTSILPTGVVPVTSVPTVVRYGEEGARVRQDGSWRAIAPDSLVEYVSQERNPGNVKGVSGLEVFLPRELLRDGLCFVDTPGLGSVFDANTTSTLEFLPHIDAALLVVGADPPISGDERRFAAELSSQTETVLCVLNKADRIPDNHRAEALAFTRKVLEGALGRPVDPIYEVSAVAAGRGPAATQGWHALMHALQRLPDDSGRRLVAAAALRGRDRLVGRLAALLDEERRALVTPLEESDRRLAAFQELVGGADRARHELAPLLDAEARELAVAFERRRDEFLAEALPHARAELRERLDVRLRRQAAHDLANDVARAHLGPWLETSEQEAGRAYRAAVTRFVTLAREFLQRVSATGDVGLHTIAPDEDAATWVELREPRGFYFANLLSQHRSPLLWAALLDRILPSRLVGRSRRRAAEAYLEHLIVVNATRVESDLRQRMEEGGRLLRADLNRMLSEVGQAAVRAVERGQAARRAGVDAVRAELERLDGWLGELRAATLHLEVH